MNEVTRADDDLTAFLEKNASAEVARVSSPWRRPRSWSPGAYAGERWPSRRQPMSARPRTASPRRRSTFSPTRRSSAALRGAGVRGVVSEEHELPIGLDPEGPLLVAIDPLDGSSNIGANVTIGTVFSVLDAPAGSLDPDHFLQRGTAQRAAGMIVYGLHVAFVFTVGRGVAIATLDPETETYRIVTPREEIPSESNEFAINCANSRHWPPPVQAYVEDLLEGEEGPRERDFNMRWVGSMVADVYRILIRGGVYLYPEDFPRGLRARQASPALRGQSRRLSDRAGRRRGDRRLSPDPRDRAGIDPCPHAAPVRRQGQDRAHRPLLR